MFFHHNVVILLLMVAVVASTTARAAEPLHSFKIAQSTIEVHFNDRFSQTEQEKIIFWLQQHAAAVTTLYGEFPLPVAKIKMEKAAGAGEPVPWGQVLRGREEGVLFQVNPQFSRADFVDDWTAAHEFSHLFIPFPGNQDSWFSEGLATYLQNTLRVRANILSEQQGWQKLYEGLRRGQRDTKMDAMSLAQLSPRMHASRSYQRVYWSGVYYFLQTEIELFTESDGKHALDSVLREFSRCCRFTRQTWSAAALAAKFDELSASRVFTRNLHAMLRTHALPDFEPLIAALGLRANRAGRVVISGKDNALRQRIMHGGPGSLAP